jgi:HNH endonuclease
MDNYEYLHDLYINKNKSALEISIITGKTREQVKKLLRKHGIRKTPMKNSGEIYDDITWLRKQYLENQKGYTQIADECGVSYSVILDRLRYHGITIRGHQDIDKGKPNRGKKRTNETIEKIKASRMKKRVKITCFYCKKIKEIQYSSFKKSQNNFCSQICYRKYLFDHRIETTEITDSAAYKEWRLKVYKRDRYRCKMPLCNSDTREIAAHHIFPKKTFPEKMFEISNGITLCKKCHEKTYGKENEYINCLVRVVQKMSD